jgi:5,6-dimethylbenzimidazole synthase
MTRPNREPKLVADAASAVVSPITQKHAEHFADLVSWRRDVRRFRTDAIDPKFFAELLRLADQAPSVGNCQPWRIVRVAKPARRAAIRANFEIENARAGSQYADDTTRAAYLALKLAGFDRAPEHIAVFADPETLQGKGLGRQTMPEMLDYSCVSYITTLWYAARSHGIGLGWVSILDVKNAVDVLDVPTHWHLIGYLLLGYPDAEHDTPELERCGWQSRTDGASRLIER